MLETLGESSSQPLSASSKGRPCPLCGRVGSREHDEARHLNTQMHYKLRPLLCPMAPHLCTSTRTFPSHLSLLAHLYNHVDRGEGEALKLEWRRTKMRPIQMARKQSPASSPFSADDQPPRGEIPHGSPPLQSPESALHHRAVSSPPHFRTQRSASTHLSERSTPTPPSFAQSLPLSSPPSPSGDSLPSLRTVTEWAFRGRVLDRDIPPLERGNPPSLFAPIGPSVMRAPPSDPRPVVDHDAGADRAALIHRNADALLIQRLRLDSGSEASQEPLKLRRFGDEHPRS